MGWNDNRRTPKMRRRQRQLKHKARLARLAEARKAERKAAGKGKKKK